MLLGHSKAPDNSIDGSVLNKVLITQVLFLKVV